MSPILQNIKIEYAVGHLYMHDSEIFSECPVITIPRTVFEAMAPEVKEKVLCDYWIPKDDTLPVLHKNITAYREFADGRVMWNVPFERFCAYDGAKMYKCGENGKPEFYCPVCKMFYADKNWGIQGD